MPRPEPGPWTVVWLAMMLAAAPAAAQPDETTDDWTADGATGEEPTDGPAVPGEDDLPDGAPGDAPSLTPPDDDGYAATGDDGTEPPPPDGDPDAGNPALDLLRASQEDAEDAQAQEDAEQVSWQEEASRFIELRGYFRTRADLFYQLNLGRTGPNARTVSAPIDNGITRDGAACTGTAGETCFTNDTIAGGNLRLRLEPIIHLSSYVQVYATLDLLDNLVLGSTPEGYTNLPADGGWVLPSRSPVVPLTAFAATQVPPNDSNSFTDSVAVKRAWAEVTTPLGRILFGRMQSQWGLGVLANAGNDIDSDYGDIADRIMWAARYEGFVGALGFDFAGEGTTSQSVFQSQGQPYDLGQLDDVNQYIAVLGYRPTDEEQLQRLRLGLPAFAGGVYYVFRNQVLSGEGTNYLGNQSPTLVQRDAYAHIVDLWFQFRYERFRAETEWVIIAGGIQNTNLSSFADEGYDVLQYGGVLQLEYTLLGQPTVRANRLRIGFEAGYASGDPNQEGLSPSDGLLFQRPCPDYACAGQQDITLFRFDPDFNVDLILFEQILGQVSGAYYIRPWVDYTLALGVGRSKKYLTFRLDMVYSRAAEPISTLSNSADLGVELDASVTFETADNFFGRLQYGVLFPLDAWEDLPVLCESGGSGQCELNNAQTVQALLGVTF